MAAARFWHTHARACAPHYQPLDGISHHMHAWCICLVGNSTALRPLLAYLLHPCSTESCDSDSLINYLELYYCSGLAA